MLNWDSERELCGVLLWFLRGLDVHQRSKSWQLLYCVLLGFSSIGILSAMLRYSKERFVSMLCFPRSLQQLPGAGCLAVVYMDALQC